MVTLKNINLKYYGIDVEVCVNTDILRAVQDVYIYMPESNLKNTEEDNRNFFSKVLNYLHDEGFLDKNMKVEHVLTETG